MQGMTLTLYICKVGHSLSIYARYDTHSVSMQGRILTEYLRKVGHSLSIYAR